MKPCRRYVRAPAYWEGACLRCGRIEYAHRRRHGWISRFFAVLSQ